MELPILPRAIARVLAHGRAVVYVGDQRVPHLTLLGALGSPTTLHSFRYEPAKLELSCEPLSGAFKFRASIEGNAWIGENILAFEAGDFVVLLLPPKLVMELRETKELK